MAKKKKLALHWKILIGMAIGIIYGLMASKSGWIDFTINYIKPFGTIFINLLKLIAMPLILFSLISGIGNLKDISKLSSMGLKTISFYLFTTVVAITIGLVLVNLIDPGASFPQEDQAKYTQMYSSQVEAKQESAAVLEDESPLQFLVDLVPSNIFGAAADNSNMLQIIFFSIFIGIAIVILPENKTKPVRDFFNSMNLVILKVIDLIMEFAPIGVFALLGTIIVDMKGDIDLFKALGLYAVTVVLGLLILIFGFYPILVKFFTKVKLSQFYKGIAPAQLLAFSTSSSAATLPVTMECCEKNLKISNQVSSFVLPIGATINMDGTSLYQAVAAVFIASAFGMDLDFGQQLTIVLTATMASIGSAAVPGAGIVMLVIVLTAIGVPSEGIALIFAVDRPLDMLRTTVNVTGDSTIASIIHRFESGKIEA
ncbi:dicarboxylate/amino acid:cation symporter [Lentimicrobium sp. S6]|uniref:dicarboxylate/amino acid:cation symporter n=1 Tax=Lentimicrobium sp. S6 TaxID=2735872 RepID=UPI001554075A|nr:dicarboxylate/amino acid:cation symporter [Lentimicrobium sp. S6]NPD46254.1 dicarboxylate/amino acid:cation symporter [Lentimicrobium sp. S6]